MPLIRSKTALVLKAIAADNPNMPFPPSESNLYVYNYVPSQNPLKTNCIVKGRAGSGYSGKKWLWFNKLDVATLTKNVDREVVRSTGGTTTLAYLEEINRRYGFDLLPEHVKDLPVMNGGTICRLTIQPENLIFCGTVDLVIIDKLPDLGSMITIRELDVVINLHDVGNSGIAGGMLSSYHDYSEATDMLRDVTLGVLDTPKATALATAMSKIDGVPWGIVDQTLYSLVGAEVLYNGPIVGVPEEYKTYISKYYDYVLLLKPTTVNTKLLAVPMPVHYNIYNIVRS